MREELEIRRKKKEEKKSVLICICQLGLGEGCHVVQKISVTTLQIKPELQYLSDCD